jgi:carbonic anhydrase/acetyltransferase-like protein (isoleucine patch superfamily)
MTNPNAFNFGHGTVPAHQHPNGGGWVANTAKVALTVFVGPKARVYDSAIVSGYACIEEFASVFGRSQVAGNAKIYGAARVFGDASISGNAHVFGNAIIHGQTMVHAGKHAGTNPAFETPMPPDYFGLILSSLSMWDNIKHLSNGEKQQVFRELADKIKKECPEASDYLACW